MPSGTRQLCPKPQGRFWIPSPEDKAVTTPPKPLPISSVFGKAHQAVRDLDRVIRQFCRTADAGSCSRPRGLSLAGVRDAGRRAALPREAMERDLPRLYEDGPGPAPDRLPANPANTARLWSGTAGLWSVSSASRFWFTEVQPDQRQDGADVLAYAAAPPVKFSDGHCVEGRADILQHGSEVRVEDRPATEAVPTLRASCRRNDPGTGRNFLPLGPARDQQGAGGRRPEAGTSQRTRSPR